MTYPSQVVQISMGEEDPDPDEDPRPLEHYHFAMSGKSFTVVTEHFQDLVYKVRAQHSKCETVMILSALLPF